MGYSGGTSGKESTCQYRIHKRFGFNPCYMFICVCVCVCISNYFPLEVIILQSLFPCPPCVPLLKPHVVCSAGVGHTQ